MALLRMNFFILFLIAFFINQVNCQELTAVRSKSNLPTPRYLASSVYDGDDIIYIFGGVGSEAGLSDFLTYTLSTDTIELIKTGYKMFGGEMVRDGDGEIYYCGGYPNEYPSDKIMKYNQVNKTWSEVARLSRITFFYDLLQPSENIALLVGGYGNPEIVLFNMTDLTTTNVGTTPPSADSTVAALYNEDEAIVFQIPYLDNVSVFKYSLSNQSFTLLSDSFPTLRSPSLVYDGSHAYIVNGGYQNLDLYGGMIQVDPSTANWTFISVNNFPSPDTFFYGTSSVYVKKLNRIYMFGGYSTVEYLDGIWWVDLDPLNPVTSTVTPSTPTTTIEPPLFDCSNKTDGMYPHPINCNMFIACHFGEGEEYECPEPLLFDPIHLTCTSPNFVECDINCSGKPDGVHPHPRDCSLFLLCENGRVSVYACPGDFLFDPIDLRCNFPELVICDV